ncbi:hypothetical protein D9758_014646 [Tetrapyrgos nigripes]|uniref:Cytochrome P450 n=1 Tax=Tetrapyrgos nigripes TaxID=182062 RepID=A0A8H5CW61_9AGAR|nr:hypothetical protein D9758_014646 [Tetrapyrgos nigripes]
MAPIGLLYLVRTILPKLLIPPFFVYYTLKASDCSTWLTFAAVLFTHPVYIVASNWYTSMKNRREAFKRGATLPPQVELGSFVIIKKIVESVTKGYPGDVYHEWSKTYGNYFGISIFGEDRIMTFEPDHIKTILATQFESFVKGPILFGQFASLLGSGVFNSDGEMWKFHRNMTRPFFSKERISDFDVFDRHADEVIKLMKGRIEEGHPIEFQDAVSRFTLDSATEFLFGKDVNSLGAGLPYPPANSPSCSAGVQVADGTKLRRNVKGFNSTHPSNVFSTSFLAAQELTMGRTRYGMHWRLWEMLGDKVERMKGALDNFVNPILDVGAGRKNDFKDNLKEGKGTGKGKEEETETFLDHLIRYTEDRQILKDELVNILVASRDTTASLLTFAIYALSQRPDIEKMLREEINEKVGTRGRPTYEHIREMKYLRAFLNETLRLYPPVPFNARSCTTSMVLPSKTGPPVYIPEGTKCLYSIFLMHRRRDLWGPDALEFDPKRFLDFRVHKYLTPNPYIFLPFNAGPRICLGQQFAYNEASFFLIKFLQSFTEIEFAENVQYATPSPSDNIKPPKEWAQAQEQGLKDMAGTTKGRDKIMFSMHLTMCVRGGLWVRMKGLNVGEGVLI